MDSLIQLIGSLSGDNEEMLRMLSAQLLEKQDILATNRFSLDQVLRHSGLDPYTHSLGYLVILSVYSTAAKEAPTPYIDLASNFLQKCDSFQVRIEPKKFRLVCQRLADVSIQVGAPHLALKALKSAISKIGGGDLLTPQHSMLALCCIKAKNYKYALPVLDRFVYEIDEEQTCVSSEQTRLYFYYGGIIYTGLKQFAKALEFFEIVVSVPCLVGSAIMLAAYKKYILVSLIYRGETPKPPKYSNPAVLRAFKTIASPYEDFATSFGTRSSTDLQKVLQNHQAAFKRDHNFGLVRQAMESLVDQNIQRLTKTYLTLSFQDIAEKVSLPRDQVERRVLKMIQQNKVFARISQKDGMVIFGENEENFRSSGSIADIDQKIQRAMSLFAKITDVDESITLSEAFLTKVLTRDLRGPGADSMDLDTHTPEMSFAGQ